jgi:phenylacetate-CoA ligase
VWHSSGSTGQQGFFVQDALAMAVYDALEATRRHSARPWLRLWDPLFLSERFAFVGATGGHFASIVSLQRLRRANPLAAALAGLFHPAAACRRWWAHWTTSAPRCWPATRRRPRCWPKRPPPAACSAGPTRSGPAARRLTGPMRSCIEQGFGGTVRNSYGASEFLPIAWECTHGRLHVNADWVILEPVDAQLQPVPPGQVSFTTLLTNLANHLQPLIRFDIGDRIALGGERCPCGCALPVVQVQGRSDDAIVLPRRRRRAGHPAAAGADHRARGRSRRVRLRTATAGAAAAAPGAGPALPCPMPRCSAAARRADGIARSQGALPPAITVTRLAAAPASASGKVKRIRGLHRHAVPPRSQLMCKAQACPGPERPAMLQGLPPCTRPP